MRPSYEQPMRLSRMPARGVQSISCPTLERIAGAGHILSASAAPAHRLQSRVALMTQTSNRFLDELAKLMTDAAGAAQGLRQDFETMMKSQGERVLREFDLVQREEFEAVKVMAVKAREENEQLAARIAALETELAGLKRQP
jgi:BMFP domain-containing protein YqiC